MNTKIILATAALALAATATAAQRVEHMPRFPTKERPSVEKVKAIVNKQLTNPEFEAKVLAAIKQTRPAPRAAANLAVLDEEQGAVTDIIVGVATNLITDIIKNWRFEEDDAEQGEVIDAVVRAVKDVLVPIATQWVDNRARDINNWIRSLDEDEAVQCMQIDRFVHQMTRDATAAVMTKIQRESRMMLMDEDAEQVAPVLVWIGGVLYKVVEGVVVSVVIDGAVNLGKKLLRGERLWDEDAEQVISITDRFVKTPTWQGYEVKKFNPDLFDEEQGCTMYGCFQMPTSLEEEQKVNWSANAGISGGAGGRPQWNVGIGATWDDERAEPVRRGRFHRPAQKF